jgi:acetyl-CoA synthetase
MRDYKNVYDTFRLEDVYSLLSENFSVDVNACFECCDRHAIKDPAQIAMRYEKHDGSSGTLSFGELKILSAKFANVLRSRGVMPGDRVAAVLPRTPELLITILGIWRLGATYLPIFTAFGGDAIDYRLKTSAAKVLVIDTANLHKVQNISRPPVLIVVGDLALERAGVRFWHEMDRSSPEWEPIKLSGDDPFILMFTSGTTGPSKSLRVPLKALSSFVAYMRDAVDLKATDKYWNLADPGWAYGLYYAIVAPLAMGCTTFLYDGPFSPEISVALIKKYGITNLAGSPTAFRLIVSLGSEGVAAIKGQLRVVSSAGEPLNPEVIRWFNESLGVTVHDQYGQTELGMVVCNFHGLKHSVPLGSAGFAMPGYRIVALGEGEEEMAPHQPGILSVDREHSPLFWFTGYENANTPSLSRCYYQSGDIVEIAGDGSISFVGRADDVITSSGYRIGPFDVESALVEHPAVVEAAVIGKPDKKRTEIVKAFVVLHGDRAPTEDLENELRQFVKAKLSAHAYPREFEFVAQLPKTPSGKIQRFMLRNAEIAKTTS